MLKSIAVGGGGGGGGIVPIYGEATPIIIGGATEGVGTYGQQRAYYVQLDKVVHLHVYLSWFAHTGTGNMLVKFAPSTSIPSAKFDLGDPFLDNLFSVVPVLQDSPLITAPLGLTVNALMSGGYTITLLVDPTGSVLMEANQSGRIAFSISYFTGPYIPD